MADPDPHVSQWHQSLEAHERDLIERVRAFLLSYYMQWGRFPTGDEIARALAEGR